MAKKNPKRNISRIETKGTKGKVYGGYEVRMQRQGKKTERYFSDSAPGGQRKALADAKKFRDELEGKTRKYTVSELAENPSSRNTSGIVGVRLHNQVDTRGDWEYHYEYYVAQWTDANGKRRTKSFSLHLHGKKGALELAKEARLKGVDEANR